MMKIYFLLLFLSVILFVEKNLALKCRTGNRQTNEQFRKVMQICRRRSSHNGRSGDFSDSDSDSNESNSDEDMFDKKFLSGNKRKTNISSGNGSNYREKFGGRQTRQVLKSSFRENNMDHRSFGDRNILGRNSNLNSQNYSNYGQEDEQRKSAVDQRGFPEVNSVTEIMTENIQDPELADFVQESILECFHYLKNNRNQDKCKFSQNLLSCLSDKGSERCDDWNDE